MDKFEIVITSKAQSDLSECVQFVLNTSLEAAKKLADDLYSSIESLTTFPERYPVFEMPKSFPYIIRKQIVNNRYIILYLVEENKVIIYRILDARKNLNSLI